MKRLYQSNKIGREKVIEKYEGWVAYASNANTFKYRKKLTSKFNRAFPAKSDIKINSVKKHENFNQKIDLSKIKFSQQKTLHLLKKGLTIQKISKIRKLKENTIWEHIANLVENHQIPLKSVVPSDKIRKILRCIKSTEDKLKEIKLRLNNPSISYKDIKIVLANTKGKHKKRSISYYAKWYQRTNCLRKCYDYKNQRKECRFKFQKLVAEKSNITFSKQEFLKFFNNSTNICILPDKIKKRFVPWKSKFLNKK